MKHKYGNCLCVFLLMIVCSIRPYNFMRAYIDKYYPAKQYVEENRNTHLSKEITVPETKLVKEITKLNARGSVLLDAENNRVLYEKDGYKQMPMASTTKIMTCIIALENGDLDDEVTFSSNAARMPDVQLNAKAGEKFKLRDLLYSLMLESHNDTAVAIAEHIGGSVEGFATLMNKKAKQLGCCNTHFVTPNGLDAEEHYTTARDLAVIASYAIRNESFIAITNTQSQTFKDSTGKRSYAVTNKDRFLYMMEGAIGVKTGYTNKAGYCFVGALKRDGKTLISVVLGSGWPPHKTYKWQDTQKLMEYGLAFYERYDIADKAAVLNDINVDNGTQISVPIRVDDRDIKLLLAPTDKIKVEYTIVSSVRAPVEKGMEIGSVNYYINDLLYTKVPVYTTASVSKWRFSDVCHEIVKMWTNHYVLE